MIKHYLNIALLLLNSTISYFLYYSTPWFSLSMTISIVLFSLILGFGVLFLKFNYFLKSINTIKSNQCLLTFDDGPDSVYTPQVLKILKEHNVKALFFVIGKKVESNPELLSQIKEDGHLIGNHTYSHNNFLSLLPQKTIFSEIEKGNETIEKFVGEKTTFFRPPIGYTNPNYAKIIKKLDIKTIGWSLRSYDTVFKNSNTLLARLLNGVRKNSIVLLHDNLPVTLAVLEEFVIKSKEKGIIFVELNQKLDIFHD